jgi:hypothetical protein
MRRRRESDGNNPQHGFCLQAIVDSLNVKNPSPEGPALISPQRGGVYLKSSNGMMEWWNNGILGLKTGPQQAD